MSEAADSILQAALKLSERERMELADALYESLPPDPEGDEDEVFLAELERRRAELAKDPSAGIPWSEVQAMMKP